MTVTANEVKIKGVSLFDKLLKKADELFINVRGKDRFVVLDLDRYKELRENELDLAYLQTREDLLKGRYKEQSVKEHLDELKDEL